VLVPVLGLSLVAAAFAYVTGIAGSRRLGARVASFVGLTEVLFATLFAAVALGQVPGLVQLSGGVVVLVGVALVRVDDDRGRAGQ
jgi:drug/metabolite transporter (DMT)-like permease